MERTKMMMNLQTLVAATKTAAAIKNAQYTSTKSHVRTIKQRWDETYKNLSSWNQQIVDAQLEAAKDEFRRRNPNMKKWQDMKLAEAKSVLMTQIGIDGTMQRQLDIFWVLKLLNQFASTMVVPIQVYRPVAGSDDYLAWDGQHTIVLLWLIATQLFDEDPATIIVPVNLYHSNLKAEMRANFISLNSKEGKKMLEAIDLWQQMIFGVRIDGATHPDWIATELKQQYIEQAGLFVTSKKFNDHDEPGAISRLQEINKILPVSVKALAKYLMLSTQLQRPVEEKEIVMMAHYFDRCRIENIVVDDAYVAELFQVVNKLWKCEFEPTGKFWVKAGNAYHSWHNATAGTVWPGKFKKEPVHGFPYMIAQLKKSLTKTVPASDSNSSFWPLSADLE
jgi:hypothetical protein